MDSGKATSPLDTFGSMSGLNEAQLIPGLVQDLQSLRLKLDTSVKRSEMLTEQYMSKMDRNNQQQRHVKTAEFACQTELQVRWGNNDAQVKTGLGFYLKYLSAVINRSYMLNFILNSIFIIQGTNNCLVSR